MIENGFWRSCTRAPRHCEIVINVIYLVAIFIFRVNLLKVYHAEFVTGVTESKIRNEVLDSENLYAWPPARPDVGWHAWPNPNPYELNPRTVKNNLQRYFGDLRPGDYVLPKHGREDHFVRHRPLPQTIDVRQAVDQDKEDFLNRMIPRRIKAIYFRQPLYRMMRGGYTDQNNQEHSTYDYKVVEWKLSIRFPHQDAPYASMYLEKKYDTVPMWPDDMNSDPIVMFDPDDDFHGQTTNDLWAKNYVKVRSITQKKTIYDPILETDRVIPAQNIYRPNLVARETGVARRGI